MATLRTPETEAKYKIQKAHERKEGICALCEKPAIKEFEHWKIVENLFPYDLIAKTHHMLAAKEHNAEDNISSEAWAEFKEIKENYIAENYSCILENMPRAMTIPAHFHVQLIVFKD